MLSGELLADDMYMAVLNGSTQLWCLGCCVHAGTTCTAPGACMTLVGVVPAPDGAPAPPDDVAIYSNVAELVANMVAHRGQHEQEARQRAEQATLAGAGATQPVSLQVGR